MRYFLTTVIRITCSAANSEGKYVKFTFGSVSDIWMKSESFGNELEINPQDFSPGVFDTRRLS